jgi:glucose-6-phosphate 1-dehydrogenase
VWRSDTDAPSGVGALGVRTRRDARIRVGSEPKRLRRAGDPFVPPSDRVLVAAGRSRPIRPHHARKPFAARALPHHLDPPGSHMTIAPSTSPNDRRADGAPAPEPHVIVLSGAFGDLSRRKLLPGLFHLARTGSCLTGTGSSARRAASDPTRTCVSWPATRRKRMRRQRRVRALRGCLSTAAFRAEDPDGLAQAVERAEEELGGRRAAPALPLRASGSGGARRPGARRLRPRLQGRVVLEKPFGTDLETSRALNALVDEVFSEEAVFRIDHFLGREAVQNLIALRFANGMFEPIWNRDHIDHVQLDVPETIGVDSRTGFYEETGAYRDMVVTHLFHLLGFVAMEPPTSLQANALGEESRKVFRAMEPVHPQDVVRGQYEGYRAGSRCSGRLGRRDVRRRPGQHRELALDRRALLPAHRQAHGRAAPPADDRLSQAPAGCSRSPTTWSRTSVRSHHVRPRRERRHLRELPGEGPGADHAPGQARMEFASDETFGTDEALEPYERLLYDAMTGDRTLFADAEGVERLWTASAPVLADPPPVQAYAPGSWGPPAMEQLIAPRRWRLPI